MLNDINVTTIIFNKYNNFQTLIHKIFALVYSVQAKTVESIGYRTFYSYIKQFVCIYKGHILFNFSKFTNIKIADNLPSKTPVLWLRIINFGEIFYMCHQQWTFLWGLFLPTQVFIT